VAAGALVGILIQRSRFCTVGAVGRIVTAWEFRLLGGVGAMVAGALGANLLLGQFRMGFAAMPVAHSDHLWNFLGMALAGLAFCLAGGCPGRQLALCSEGNTDAAVFVLGSVGGAAVAHEWFLAAAPDRAAAGVLTIGGPGPYGKIAVLVGLAFCAALGLAARRARGTA
jgi:YedE family putative selenium metabolism protein